MASRKRLPKAPRARKVVKMEKRAKRTYKDIIHDAERDKYPFDYAIRNNPGIGNDEIEDEIAEGMARAFIEGNSEVMQWEDEGFSPYPTEQTTEKLTDFIIDFASEIVRINDCALSDCYRKALDAINEAMDEGWKPERDPTPERFGWDIAMQAQGHGVGWNDYFPEAGVRFPEAQVYFYLDEQNNDDLLWDTASIDPRFISEI